MKRTVLTTTALLFISWAVCFPIEIKGAQVTGPWAAWAGTYSGLAADSNDPASHNLFFTATLTTAGRASIKLQLGGKTSSLSGAVANDGSFSGSISRPGLAPLNVHLQLASAATDSLLGEISEGASWTADLAAYRGIYNAKTNPAPQTGKYTFYVGADEAANGTPTGHGYATMTISTSGGVAIAGVLPDGTKLTQKSQISGAGLLPFYAGLYAGHGSISGWLTLSNQPSSDLEGSVYWVKAAQKSKLYPGGFSNLAQIVGSKYQPGAPPPLFDFSAGEVSLIRGNLSAPVFNDVMVGSDNKVTDLGINKLAMSITSASGLFKGALNNPASGKRLNFSGVILQKQNAGYGYFLGSTESGDVTFNSGLNVAPDTLEDAPLPVGSLVINGTSESGFNSMFAPLTLSLTGIRFSPDVTQFHLVVNGQEVPSAQLQLDHHTISTANALVDGRNEITFSGVDLAGRPLFLSQVIWAGPNMLHVYLVNPNGSPFKGMATVTASMGDDQTIISQKQTSTGSVQFENVPSRTIFLSALSSGNQSALTGVVGDVGFTQITVLGFQPPSQIDNNDFSLGLDGWQTTSTSVEIGAHDEGIPPTMKRLALGQGLRSEKPRMPVAMPRLPGEGAGLPAPNVTDQDMILTTSGEGEQSISRTFQTQPGTSTVRVRYRFITSEVPGGYFGSQYNDYFRVTIRSQNGAGISQEANSMNGLGLGAFDYASGATDWRQVTLHVDPSGDIVEVGVAVANVADGLLDSQVVVDFIEEVKDHVLPSLSWNNTAGGINLSFEVKNGPLPEQAEIDVYWANGGGYENRMGSPLFSYTVPAGTPTGHYGPVRIDGSMLADDPNGVTHVIAVASPTSVGSLKDVKVNYGDSANASVVWPEMLDIVKDSLRAAGQSSATITSTIRSPADQARAMFNNLVHQNDTLAQIAHNVDVQKNGDGGTWHGYGAPGDAVIDEFVAQIDGMTADEVRANSTSIQAAMEQEIINQDPYKVSHHCGDPNLVCVIDIYALSFNASNGPIFVGSASPRLSRYIDERGVNKCYHFELQ